VRFFGLFDESIVGLLFQLGLTLRFLSWVVIHLEELADDVQVHEIRHKGRKDETYDRAENYVDTTCQRDGIQYISLVFWRLNVQIVRELKIKTSCDLWFGILVWERAVSDTTLVAHTAQELFAFQLFSKEPVLLGLCLVNELARKGKSCELR